MDDDIRDEDGITGEEDDAFENEVGEEDDPY